MCINAVKTNIFQITISPTLDQKLMIINSADQPFFVTNIKCDETFE